MHHAILAFCVTFAIVHLAYRSGFRDALRPAARRVSRLEARLSSQLRSLGFATYTAYLASAHWKHLKREKMRRQGVAVCAGCAVSKRLSLHHATYDRIGYERLDDVVLLCAGCHRNAHAVANRTGDLRNAHNVLRSQRRTRGMPIGPTF